jgi:pyruvate dehydrogenase E1 component alpha subunit
LESLGVESVELDGIEAAATVEIDEATEVSKASPPPDPSILMTEVWADGGSSWRN